jgi:hypothetical protein
MAILGIDVSTLPGPAQKVVAPDGNPKLKTMAARGILPGLRPHDIVTVLVLLRSDPDSAVAKQAEKTLFALPAPILTGAMAADLPAAVIDALAEPYLANIEVVSKLLRMQRVAIETVVYFASRGGEPVTELVAINQERLLSHPEIIAALYMNKHTRMSTADRIVELAARMEVEVHGIPAWKEASLAIKDELIAEPSDEPLPDDEFFRSTAQLAETLAADDLVDDAAAEDKFKPLLERLSEMTVSQKIRRAMLGTKGERMALIREQNKVIATAAARSPLLKEPEVVLIARNRGVTEDVLRILGNTPEWLKSYQIKKNLVENSKCPIAIAQRLIPHLRENDLRRLAKNRNVSSAIQLAARRYLERRRQ